MILKMHQVDAFTDRVFGGNPAAICLLEDWLSDGLMQKIAMENNLAETAFLVKENDVYHIRWFTPTIEVDLCGHATLASAYVLFDIENYMGDTICFYSHRSGSLSVTKENDWLILDFPADVFEQTASPANIELLFDIKPVSVFKGKTDYIFLFESEKQIKDLHPDLLEIARLKARGVIATAKGDQVDFVSRFFAPQSGVNEDPVTGSAHTTLIPFWVKRLNKTELTAMQLSSRGGYLRCSLLGDRVAIGGQSRLYFTGDIFIGDAKLIL